MDAGLRSTLNCALRDGRIKKAEVKDLAESALDGKGVTRNELKDLKQIRDRFGDQMTSHARKSLDSFISGAGRSWSRTKEVHLPNVDEDRLQSLLNSEPRLASSGRRVGGSESGTGSSRDTGNTYTPPPPRSRRVAGGE